MGRRRTGIISLAIGLAVLAGSPALAVSKGQIERFLRSSDAFEERLPRSPILRLSDRQRRARAACILTEFEAAHGTKGLRAVFDLMAVLSSGAEFDDPTIISFNDRFGPEFDRIESSCTNRAVSS